MALTKITGEGLGSVSGVNLSSGNVTVIDGQGFYFGDGSYRIEGKDDGANARIGFVTNSSEIARFTSNGLTFNGDTAAANALDDYEEGSWTPTSSNNAGTLTTAVGIYTKIGRVVYVSAYVAFTGAATGSDRVYGGLPFTVKDWNGNTVVDFMGQSWGNHRGYINFQGGSTLFEDNLSTVGSGSFAANAHTRFAGFYFTDL